MTKREKAQFIRSEIAIYRAHMRMLRQGFICDPAGCPCGGLGELALEIVPAPRTETRLADFYDFTAGKKEVL